MCRTPYFSVSNSVFQCVQLRILVCRTPYLSVSNSLLDPTGPYWTLLDLTGPYWTLLDICLAVPTVLGENMLDLFLAVPTVVGENILEVCWILGATGHGCNAEGTDAAPRVHRTGALQASECERSSRRRYLTFVATALSNVRRDGVI